MRHDGDALSDRQRRLGSPLDGRDVGVLLGPVVGIRGIPRDALRRPIDDNCATDVRVTRRNVSAARLDRKFRPRIL